jgi:hypothetical protein
VTAIEALARKCAGASLSFEGEPIMSNPFKAEVLFLDPGGVKPATEALAKVGCRFVVNPDARDPYSDAVFGWVSGETGVAENEISHWLLKIIDEFSGDVVEFGFAHRWN